MKKFLLLFALLMPCFALAQSTTVTATITDSDGVAWANGTYQLSFVPNPQVPSSSYIWQGSQINPGLYASGSLDGSGVLSVSIPDNAFISPSGSQWTIAIAPNASSSAYSYTTTITGTSLNLTSILSALSIAPRFSPGINAFGYSTVEVFGPRNPGSAFYNVTLNCSEAWNGTVWGCIGGSGSGNVTTLGLNANYIVYGTGTNSLASATILVTAVAQGLTTGCPGGITASDGLVNFNVPSCATTLDSSGNGTFQGTLQAGVGAATHYYQFPAFGNDPSCGPSGKACIFALTGSPNKLEAQVDGGTAFIIQPSIAVGATAGGDLSGTYPNPTVAKVNGNTPGGTCTNQFPRSIDSSGRPTCASVNFANDGTGIVPNANLLHEVDATFSTVGTTRFIAGRHYGGTFPIDLAGATAACDTNPASSITLTVYVVHGGISTAIGTIVLNTSCAATLATTSHTTQTFVADDRIAITPGGADASAINVSLVIPYTGT